MLFNDFITALAISAGLVDVGLAAKQGDRWSRGRHSRFNASHSISSASFAASTASTATTATLTTAVNGTGSVASAAASATVSVVNGDNNVLADGCGGDKNLALKPSLVQTGSQNNGSLESGAETGQIPSATYVFPSSPAVLKS